MVALNLSDDSSLLPILPRTLTVKVLFNNVLNAAQNDVKTDDVADKEPVDFSSKARTARAEFIAQLRDVCVHILHSREGARVTMNSLWHGSAKDRKGNFTPS